jgi:uncharacterized protein (DUF1330 family)
MTDALTLVVLLHVDPEHTADYERFEAAASRIMGRHGGRIERRVAVGGDAGRPDEVHIVTFPSENNFDAYLQDPELAGLGDLRARAIRRTVVWRGRDLPGFPKESP